MKLLLVLGSDDNHDAICKHIQPLGFEIIRYRHVLKAIDNIDEIDPAAIMVSERDFPRHWKILVQFVRSERFKETCPIVILKGSSFSTEETSKAFFMGANGVLADTLNNREDINRLRAILGRAINEERQQYLPVEPWHRVSLLIADASNTLISTDVKSISAYGLSFSPLTPLPPQTFKLNTIINECSLRVGDTILSPVCRISTRQQSGGKTIALDFTSFPRNEWQVLDQYLEEFQMPEAMIAKAS